MTRRRQWYVVGWLGVLAAGGWWGYQAYRRATVSLPALPQVDLAGVEPLTADQIRAALALTQRHPRRPETNGRLGMMYHAHQFLEAAQTCYERARLLDPKDSRWHYLPGVIQERFQDPERAMAHYRQAIACGADYLPAYIRLGQLLTEGGRFAEAEEVYRQAQTIDSQEPRVDFGLGRIAVRYGRLDEAVERLGRAVAVQPDFSQAHNALGLVYRRLGQERQAQIHLAKARRPPKVFPDPLYDEVFSLRRGYDHYYREGMKLLRDGMTDDAREMLRRSIAANTAFGPAHVALARALLRLGRDADAIPEFQAALAINAYDVDALLGFGVVCINAGRLEEADHYLSRLVKLRPGHAPARQQLAQLLLRRGDEQGAIEHLRVALKSDPTLEEARTALLDLLVRQAQAAQTTGRADEALALQLEVFGLQSASPRRYATTVDGLTAAKQFAAALETASSGLRHHPRSVGLLRRKAWLLSTAPREELRDATAALALAKQALNVTGRRDATLLDVQAAAYAETGRFEDAVATAQEALERARSEGPASLIEPIKSRLARYRTGRPYHESASR